MSRMTAPLSLRPTTDDLSTAASRLVDVSRAMRQVRVLATRAAAGDAKVFITGESGVGKDVVAQYIHAHSTRASRPFIAVNCAAIADTLLETELFGHARGSFTGAYRDRIGRLEAAHRGTIFLDEIGEMSLQMQAHLLDSSKAARFSPSERRRADPRRRARSSRRPIATSSSSWPPAPSAAICSTASRSCTSTCRRCGNGRKTCRRSSRQRPRGPAGRFGSPRPRCRRCRRYRWPGNVRELQNVIEQAAWMSESPDVDVSDLPEIVRLASTDSLTPRRERRRRLADELYSTLVDGHYTFWGHIHPLLLKRDITRHDLRQLVSLGLSATRGNYRGLLKLFGMPEGDYKRFMNFLAAHDCTVNYRQFRAPGPIGAQQTPIGRAFDVTDRQRCRAAILGILRFLNPILATPRAPGSFATLATPASLPASIETAFESRSRNRGLLGRSSLSEESALILAPCSSIHTCFMRFAIDVAFVDRDGNILRARRALRPWRVQAAFRASAVIELAAGALDRSDTRVGDRLYLAVE